MWRWLLAATVCIGTAATQDVLLSDRERIEVALRDGSIVVARGFQGDARGGYVLETATGRRQVAPEDLVALYGVAATPAELLQARLAGGDTLYGALAGGDDAGQRIELITPVFGRLALAIDRLDALLQPAVEATELSLPAGVDEALFVPTAGGYDVVAGTLHRCGAQGILFQPAAADTATWFGPSAFAGLRLSGAVPRATPRACTLLTRTADRVGVELRSAGATGFAVELEDGTRHDVRHGDVACLTFHEGLVHLSDLTPREVFESGYDGDVVLPWQRDRSAVGGVLSAAGRSHAKGLGVHSRSRLSFEVPAGATHFWTRIAIDDSAAELPLRAHAVARLSLGGSEVFVAEDLRPGETPRDSGRIAVKPGDTLVLDVDFGQGRDLGDRVDWLTPVFFVEPRRS